MTLKNIFGKNLRIATIFSFILLALFQYSFAENLQKDTDLDGISDKAEIEVYHTDPTKIDTDGDTVLDYREILDKTDPLDPKSNKIEIAKKLAEKTPILWYVGRMSGIAAFIMFTLVICSGLLMTSKILLKFKFASVPEVMDGHQFNATFIAFSFVVLHIFSFILDDYFKLKIYEAFVPFLLKRDLNSALGFNISIPVSLGIIAFYLSLLLIITSQFRNKIISAKTWRLIHYSSFLFYIVFFVHGVLSGTDSKYPWMIAIYIISFVLVFSLVLLRIFGKQYFLPRRITNVQAPVQPKVESPTQESTPSTVQTEPQNDNKIQPAP